MITSLKYCDGDDQSPHEVLMLGALLIMRVRGWIQCFTLESLMKPEQAPKLELFRAKLRWLAPDEQIAVLL